MSSKALITGASSGIGEAFARLLAQEDYDLVLVARHKDKLDALKKSLAAQYPHRQFSVIAQDLGKPGAASAVYKQANTKKQFIDVLINNAGVGDYTDFTASDDDKNRQMIELNILALTELARLAATDMKARMSGRIINVGSIAGFFPGPRMAVYYATKSYVISFSEALAEELAGTGAHVTCLCPGATRSHFDIGANLANAGIFSPSRNLPSAQEVATFGWLAAKTNKVVAIHGRKNRLLIVCSRLLPRSVIRSIMRKHLAIT